MQKGLRTTRLGQNLIDLLVLIKKRVVHRQISLCSSRIVETLATYRKLDSTITHLQYLDLKLIQFFCTASDAAHINNKSLWNTGK